MKVKKVIRGLLLLYVAASVLSLLVKELGGRRDPASGESPGAANAQPATEEGKPTGAAKPKTPVRKVIAYYFHGNFRCVKCRSIEAHAKEAVEKGFPEAMKDGRLEWRVFNVEESENEHFIKDFELSTRSVVIAEVEDGKSKRWKNLEKVWELVREKDAFLQYVREETQAYLEAEKP
jgi:hypothetical protein